jgi:hypothetical protein
MLPDNNSAERLALKRFKFSGRTILTFVSCWLIWSGCATETLKPTFPTGSGLKQPDRVLIYDFAVTPSDLTPAGIVGSGLNPKAVQSEEDIRVGRTLSRALSKELVGELVRRGINASLAGEAARPGESTASIRGQFQSAGPGQQGSAGFTLMAKELRTRLQVLQGSELNLRVVAEAEYTTSSSLRPGLSPEILAKAVSADASRAATALADRVADYYRKQGWLN